MPAIHRILVAIKELDGKPLPAVLKAAQLARAYGARWSCSMPWRRPCMSTLPSRPSKD